ncbi:MAG: hypothetical protein K8R68_06295 [Bacteroidales bacterium]|nr:hypothetical protein [Bacteroidales bacterium]
MSFFLILPLINFSCGFYSFSGSSLPSHLRTVAIPMFENKTSEFGVREDITDAIINQFTQDNSLKVTDRRSADSIILGTITNIREQAGAYNAEEQVKEIKVNVYIHAKFEDLKKHKVIWEEQIIQWGIYNPNLPAGEEGSTRQDAIKEAIDKIVADIFNKTVSGW